MSRFVILEHDYPTLHWDLMLETGSLLRTWRLASPLGTAEMIAATATFDHRLAYLDYEGPISGGRGRVIRRESGLFAWRMRTPDQVVVHLDGERLHGVLRLQREEGECWRGEFDADANDRQGAGQGGS